MIKSFLALAVIALVLGVSLGGAFVGGSIYGRSTASNGSYIRFYPNEPHGAVIEYNRDTQNGGR